jgi:type I restriction enzyme S subunit
VSKWEWVPAGSVAAQRKDIVRLEDGVEYTTMGVRWYGKGAYDRGIGTTKTIKAKSLFRATAGDFVFNRIDTQNGAFDVVPGALDGALATNEFPLYATDPERILPRFLLLYFQQQAVLSQIDAMRAGSEGRSRWKTGDFEAWPIPLPPLAEQRRIVDVMAAVDAQIEALAEEVARACRALELLRADVPEAEERVLDEVLLGIDSGKSVRTTSETPEEGQPRVLKLSAVQLGSFDAGEAKRLDDASGYSSVHLVSEGDLLVTRASGSLDRVGYASVAQNVPARTYMPDLIWRIRPNESLCSAAFLGHLLAAPEFRARVTSTARGTASMRKINKRGFGAMRIPVPGLAEQRDYIARCDATAAVVGTVRGELAHLRTFRTSLLTTLLRQEVEVPESYDALLPTADLKAVS